MAANHRAGQPAAVGGGANQAQLEQRRQELEAARRARLEQARQQAAGRQTAGGANPANRSNDSNAGRAPESSNDDRLPNNGAPSLDDILRDNPWLRDYAPGGQFANNTGSNSSTNNPRSPSGSSGSNSSSGSNAGSGSNSGSNGNNGQTIVGGNGGGPVLPMPATTAAARWIPIDNRACTAAAGSRTNDLYIRLDTNAPVLGMSSENTPITITGGSFFQISTAGDDLPLESELAATPCVAFDTYLNGGSNPGFTLVGGSTNNPVFTSTTANGSLFNFSGVRGVQNPELFGDQGYYVYFGRFSASTAITGLTGTIAVDTGTPGTSTFRSFNVPVTFEPTLWAFNAAFGNPAAPPPPPPPPPPPGDDDDDDDMGGDDDGGDDGGTGGDGGGDGGGDDGGTGGNDGGNGGDDDGPPDPCASQAPGLTAVWLPINNNACVNADEEIDLGTFRTADLYLRLAATDSDSPTPFFQVQSVASVSETDGGAGQLMLVGGQFFEHSAGGNSRPNSTLASQVGCLVFDTYLAIDTLTTEAASGSNVGAIQALSIPQGASLIGSESINGFWFVADVVTLVNAVAEPAKFPNDPCGRYVRIGRFTITRGASLSGAVSAMIRRPNQSNPNAPVNFETVEVVVPNCAACWGTSAP